MPNRTIEWLKEQCVEWQSSIERIESGLFKTSTFQHGEVIDTTNQTLERYREWIAHASRLIDAHERKESESNPG